MLEIYIIASENNIDYIKMVTKKGASQKPVICSLLGRQVK